MASRARAFYEAREPSKSELDSRVDLSTVTVAINFLLRAADEPLLSYAENGEARCTCGRYINDHASK